MTHYLKAHGLQLLLVAALAIAALVGVLPDALANGLSPEHSLGLIVGAGVVSRVPTVAPFPTDPVLTGIVIAYRNDALIADEVLPRVPVSRREYRYMQYAMADGFTLPETRVGRRGRPNTTEFGGTEATGVCNWEALDAEIPSADINEAPPGHNPVNQHVMLNRDLIALKREKRVADLVFNANTYPVGRKATLSGSDRWSDPASKPIEKIEEAKDGLIMRPNIGVLGRKTWRYLRTHPQILKAIHKNDGDAGIASRRAVAELFELEDLYIGEGWVNLAKPGQAPNMVRVWGEHAAFLHRNRSASTIGGITFGFTAEVGRSVAGQWHDKDIGVEGGIRARTGECVGEKVCAPDVGYFFQNAGDDSGGGE
jgi:hypothetical protein